MRRAKFLECHGLNINHGQVCSRIFYAIGAEDNESIIDYVVLVLNRVLHASVVVNRVLLLRWMELQMLEGVEFALQR